MAFRPRAPRNIGTMHRLRRKGDRAAAGRADGGNDAALARQVPALLARVAELEQRNEDLGKRNGDLDERLRRLEEDRPRAVAPPPASDRADLVKEVLADGAAFREQVLAAVAPALDELRARDEALEQQHRDHVHDFNDAGVSSGVAAASLVLREDYLVRFIHPEQAGHLNPRNTTDAPRSTDA